MSECCARRSISAYERARLTRSTARAAPWLDEAMPDHPRSADAPVLPASTQRWSAVHQLFHWGIAALIVAQLVIGFFFLEFKDNQPPPLLPLHASLGVLTGLLMLTRLVWRLRHPVLPLPDVLTPRLKRLATATHFALYALVITQFVVGYFLEDTFGTQVHLFFLPLPVIVGEVKGWPKVFGVIHQWIGYSIVAVLALHIAAALAHEFWFRDNVLRRMTPLRFRQTRARLT
jgi:cytochrome b561